MVDALELPGEEGRGKLRKARGRSKHPEIPGCPNGVTWPAGGRSCMPEHIGYASDTRGTEPSQYPEEEKSSRDSLSSGERRGKSLNGVGVSGAALLTSGWRTHCPRCTPWGRSAGAIAERHWEGRPEGVTVP